MDVYWYDIGTKSAPNIVSIHKVKLIDGEEKLFTCPQDEFANSYWQTQHGDKFSLIVNASRSEALFHLKEAALLPAIEIQLSLAGDAVLSQTVRQL